MDRQLPDLFKVANSHYILLSTLVTEALERDVLKRLINCAPICWFQSQQRHKL